MTNVWRPGGQALVFLAMAAAAFATGLSLAYGPTYAVGLLVLVGVILWPSIGLALAIGIESCKLLLILAGVSSTSLAMLVTVSLLTAALSRTLRDGFGPKRLMPFLGLGVISVGPGLLIGISQFAPLHMVSTINLLLTPFAAYFASQGASATSNKRLLKFVILLLAANAIACIWQLSTGVAGLVAAGLDYGSTVRQIDGILRTPGLTTSSATAGLFAGAALSWLAVGLRMPFLRVGWFWTGLGVVAGGVVLIYSTSRSGALLVALAALGVIIFWSRAARTERARSKMSVVGNSMISIGILAIPIVLAQYGTTSADSFFERILVWQGLLEGNIKAFGIGAGSVGASSYSAHNANGGVFVDNSWLSYLIQYGVVGFLVLFLTFVALFSLVRRIANSRQDVIGKGAVVGAMLFSYFTTALFVELFDYVIAMTILGCVLGQSLAGIPFATPVESARRTSLRI